MLQPIDGQRKIYPLGSLSFRTNVRKLTITCNAPNNAQSANNVHRPNNAQRAKQPLLASFSLSAFLQSKSIPFIQKSVLPVYGAAIFRLPRNVEILRPRTYSFNLSTDGSEADIPICRNSTDNNAFRLISTK